MKVGDLVWCPAFDGHAAYAGRVLGVYGHKAEILGGSVVSWEGIVGRTTWDLCDIHLINLRSQSSVSENESY